MLDWLDIATLSEMKNLDGGFVVHGDPELPFLLREGMRVALVPPVLDVPREAEVVYVSMMGDATARVKFAQITTAEQAEQLVGCHCLARKEDIGDIHPLAGSGNDIIFDGDVLYADELIDWQVEDGQGTLLGTVADVDESPAHPLLVLALGDGGEAMIPLVEDFIVEIDGGSRTIAMNLPKGLLDI